MWLSSIGIYSFWSSAVKLYDADNQPFCVPTSPFWTFIYLAVTDFVVSTLLAYLFVKRLARRCTSFLVHVGASDRMFLVHVGASDRMTLKTISRIAKYVTLGIIGVSTTFFSLLLFGTLHHFTFIALDVFITGWCVLMMYARNARLFSLSCGRCHRLTGRCFFRCVRTQTLKKIKSISQDNASLAENMCAEIYELRVTIESVSGGVMAPPVAVSIQLGEVIAGAQQNNV